MIMKMLNLLVSAHPSYALLYFCCCPGKSLVVDMWSPSLRGMFGRLLSFPQLAGPTGYCLSFFYKLYGPNTGELKTVYIAQPDNNIVVL